MQLDVLQVWSFDVCWTGKKMWKSSAAPPVVSAYNLHCYFLIRQAELSACLWGRLVRPCMPMRYDKTEEITAGNIKVLCKASALFFPTFMWLHKLTIFFAQNVETVKKKKNFPLTLCIQKKQKNVP